MLKIVKLLAAAGAALATALLPLSGASAQTSGDWPTYLGNTVRSGYNATSSAITASSAPKLTQLWARHKSGAISAEPVTSNGVVYYGSWDGYERAVNARTGARLWSAYLGQTTDTRCRPPTVGVASTATVGTIPVNGTTTQAVFVGGGDGDFYALDASTGAVIWKTQLGTPPHHFLWSSPLLYNGSIYEGISSFGDCPLIRGGIVQMAAATGTVQNTLYTVPAGCRGASVWGSPTVDSATGDIYFGTGNPGSCSTPETLAIALIQTSSSLNLLSSWQVPGNQRVKDSDFGSTPTLFSALIGGVPHALVGLPNKNGTYYAFNRSSISSGPIWRRKISNGGSCPQCGKSDIAPSAYNGQHLFVGGEKGKVKGTLCAGSISELEPSTGRTAWEDCIQSGPVLGAVTSIPGVVFAGAGNTVYAVDMVTGAILWKHKDKNTGSDFWGPASIANGVVYIGNQDGNLYAFNEQPDLNVALHPMDVFRHDRNATYRVRVHNAGGATAAREKVVVHMPSGMTRPYAHGTGWACQRYDRRVVCVHSGHLRPDRSVTFYLRIHITARRGTRLTTRATVTPAGSDTNNTARSTVRVR